MVVDYETQYKDRDQILQEAQSYLKEAKQPPLPGDTGWIFAGYYNTQSNTWQQGSPYVRLSAPGRQEEKMPFVIGDHVEVTTPRRVVIVDFRNSGLLRKMDSPLAAGYKEEEDYTGILLAPGTQLDVRDVISGEKPGGASAFWLRIAYLADPK